MSKYIYVPDVQQLVNGKIDTIDNVIASSIFNSRVNEFLIKVQDAYYEFIFNLDSWATATEGILYFDFEHKLMCLCDRIYTLLYTTFNACNEEYTAFYVEDIIKALDIKLDLYSFDKYCLFFNED